MSQQPVATTTAQQTATIEIGAGPKKVSILASFAAKFNIDPTALYDVLVNTVIKGKDGRQPTNAEVAGFLMVANKYNLDPLLRQITAFVGKDGGIYPVVGIDGHVALAQMNEKYDGCEIIWSSEIIEREIEYEDWGPVKGQKIKKKTTIRVPEWCQVNVFVKGRGHNGGFPEYFDECYRNTEQWRTKPRRMLMHKAFIQNARYALSITGIYDEDEAQRIVETQDAHVVSTAPQLPPGGTKSERLASVLDAGEEMPQPVDPPPPNGSISPEEIDAAIGNGPALESSPATATSEQPPASESGDLFGKPPAEPAAKPEPTAEPKTERKLRPVTPTKPVADPSDTDKQARIRDISLALAQGDVHEANDLVVDWSDGEGDPKLVGAKLVASLHGPLLASVLKRANAKWARHCEKHPEDKDKVF